MAGKSTSPETIINLTDGREAFGSSEGTCKEGHCGKQEGKRVLLKQSKMELPYD